MKLTPDLGLLTLTQETILAALSSQDLGAIYDKLLMTLLPLTIVLYGLAVIAGKADVNPFYKVVTIAIYMKVTKDFNILVEGMMDLFSSIGIAIGGNGSNVTADILMDPSDILGKGFAVIVDIWMSASILDIILLPDFSIRALSSLLVFIYFCFLSVSCMLYVLSYHILISLSLILFVFGILGGPFRFLRDSFITVLFRQNIVIMVFSFILSASFSVFEEIVDELSSTPS